MIRFSYDPPAEAGFAYAHYSIEGDNQRGYVLLAWNMGIDDPVAPLQAWFETLGEALTYCSAEFAINRDDWHAPTVEPPVKLFSRVSRGRRKGEATVLNAENVRDRERRGAPGKP
jgi:hypothetical protein